MRLIVSNNADQFIECEILHETKSLLARLAFATREFLIWFLLAVVSIFIPVAHFVLVPVFLVVSLVRFKIGFDIKERIKAKSEVLCCTCKSVLVFPESLGRGSSLICVKCNQRYKIEV